MTTKDEAQRLIESDLAHLIHPQYHVRDHANPVIYARGEGALIWDIHGKEYIDGLAALWNVAVGHGRAELADVAAEQMRTLAFSNAYAGYTNVPSIKLAERLMELVYPNMQSVFFCNSGSEAVEGALKIARFFWHLQGKPDKVKVIARKEAYHGGTYGATAVTGLPGFQTGFGPMLPGIVRVETCYPYRCASCDGNGDDCGRHCADAIERAILDEGPETVAAVIGEPVHGAGGVIVPADGYWQRVREICDRHDVLLIADEVITGFGRTGKWFALEHWGVQPDIMSVAKAITSAYIPLAGFIMSRRIHEAIQAAPPDAKFWHGYTNAGHPAACAVALRNLQIIEDERLVDNAAAMGRRLIEGLRSIEHPGIGEVRGLGLIAAVELVADRSTRERFDPPGAVGARVVAEMRDRGVITRARLDSILLAPPLVITEEQVDRIIETVEGSIHATIEV